MVVDFHPRDQRLLLYHFESTASTQDEARLIAESFPPSRDDDDESVIQTFCVTAGSQSNGRGTSGRQWMGAPGNVFVTIGIPIETWTGLKNDDDKEGGDGRPIPLTLLPLKVGDLVASHVQHVLDEECGTTEAPRPTLSPPPMVTVKWPNDVLVDDKKISGTLIESAHGWFLIGIGINLAHAPDVPVSGPDHGRPAVSVDDVCHGGNGSRGGSDDPRRDNTLDEEASSAPSRAREVGVQLAYDLHTWLNRPQPSPTSSATTAGTVSASSIVGGWKRWVDWDMEWTMRDTPGRERVRIVDVLPDGRVRVRSVADGTDRTLVSDYFA